jgi:transcriptional regulator with PAS, ATPase and Fis domain
VDVRVIAATNRNLEEEVKAGKFREDLFYRLQVMPIVLPALRERRGDVLLLANFYINRYNSEFRKRVKGLTPDAQAMLEQYRWPGNVRELRNAIERAMLLADKDRLAPDDFTTLSRTSQTATFRLPPEGVNLEEVERQLLVQALERSHGNQTRAGCCSGSTATRCAIGSRSSDWRGRACSRERQRKRRHGPAVGGAGQRQ